MRRRLWRLATEVAQWQSSKRYEVKASPRKGLCTQGLVILLLATLVLPCQTASLKGLPVPRNSTDIRLAKFLLHSDDSVESGADSASGFPWARCSSDSSKPVIMGRNEECPPECPYSQMVEGMSCEKLCVPGHLCRKFHPVLHFPDVRTMQCAPACGVEALQHIGGCAECVAPGVCKRCARGLFGITQLELSEDGTQCINLSTKWWYLFYCFCGLMILLLALYLIELTFRARDPREIKICETNLAKAILKRGFARRELTGLMQKCGLSVKQISAGASEKTRDVEKGEAVEKSNPESRGEQPKQLCELSAPEQDDPDLEVDLKNEEGAEVCCKPARFGKNLDFYCQRCLGATIEVSGSLTLSVNSPMTFKTSAGVKASLRQAIANHAKTTEKRVHILHVAIAHREKRATGDVYVDYKIFIPASASCDLDWTDEKAATTSLQAAQGSLLSSLESEMAERGVKGIVVSDIAANEVSCERTEVIPAEPGSTGECRLGNQCASCEKLQAEHDKPDLTFTEASFHNRETASKRGGRGIVLYFNWLAFGMIAALVLACGHFIAFELSDLGRHSHAEKEGESCLLRQAHYSEKKGSLSTYITPEGKVFHRSEKEESIHNAVVQDWRSQAYEALRDTARVIATEAEPTGSFAARYAQAHYRMFKSAIVVYIVVVGLVFAIFAYQLAVVIHGYHAQEPHARGFAAVVSGLPKQLFHGKVVTSHFRDLFEREEKNLQKLWEQHGGERRDDFDRTVSMKDRFWVVGTSIAFDFNLQQDSVNHEVHCWIEDLERESESRVPALSREASARSNLPNQVSANTQTRTESLVTNRGMQTESRGNILEQLREEVPEHTQQPIFDNTFLKFMGLEEEVETTFMGSGSAFVVFATEAARDAAVSLYRGADAPRFQLPNSDQTFRLTLSPAHCEPVSIKWQNFGPLSHFVVKGVLCVVMIAFSMIAWIALSLPSAAFIADTALIPGVSPSFVQNLLLGLLIAVGNQLIALVVDIVTEWMGFLYKDSRDVAVLGLAFVFTLCATIFDLLVVGVTAHGMVLENAFKGRDAGYEPVVANEIFFLTVPGYLVLPYLGIPIGERVLPYFLAFYLIRSHGKVTLRSAKMAMRSPEFDICWRYSDILNNTTICIVLLYFTSNKAWQVMGVLFLFLVIIYVIDKYTLLYAATPAVYDTHRLSTAFAFWWCLPTTMLAGLISYWGYRSRAITDFGLCVAIPILHVVVYLTAMSIMEGVLRDRRDAAKQPVHYPEMMRKLVQQGKPWDYFNTNPVFCLRTRYLGADETGWKEVVRFQQTGRWDDATSQDGGDCKESDECVPFVRGSLRVLQPTLDKMLSPH